MARAKNSDHKKKNNGANVGYEAELWQRQYGSGRVQAPAERKTGGEMKPYRGIIRGNTVILEETPKGPKARRRSCW
jgi:hypothetical protein